MLLLISLAQLVKEGQICRCASCDNIREENYLTIKDSDFCSLLHTNAKLIFKAKSLSGNVFKVFPFM